MGTNTHLIGKVCWNSRNLKGFVKEDREADIQCSGFYENYGFASEWFNFFDFSSIFPEKFEKRYYYGFLQSTKGSVNFTQFSDNSLIFFFCNDKIYGLYGKANAKKATMDYFGEITLEEIYERIQDDKIKTGIKDVLNDKKIPPEAKKIRFNIRGEKDYSLIFETPVSYADFSGRLIQYIDDKKAIDILKQAYLCSKDQNVCMTIQRILKDIFSIEGGVKMDKKKENKGKRRHCLARIAWSEEKWQGFNMDDVVNAGEKIKKYGDIGYVTKYKFAHDWFTFYPDLHEIDDKFEKGYYYGYVQASGRGEDREHHPEEHGFINGCSLIFFLSTKENKRFIVGVYGKAEFLKDNKLIPVHRLKERGFPFDKTGKENEKIKNVEFNIRGAKEYSVVFDKFIPVEEIEKSLNIKIDMRSAMTSYKFGEVEFDDNIASKILCIAREKSEDEKVKETINKILNLIHGICLSAFLPQDYLKDLLVSVLAKPFVILAGITGTGKSLVAKEFAKAICAKHILIPVRPDWTDSSGLLGYKNVFTNQWVSTPFLEFILAADKDKDTPYVAILDEMNLARVEYYFSDFLSVLEDKERRTSGMNIEKLPMAVTYKGEDWKWEWFNNLISKNKEQGSRLFEKCDNENDESKNNDERLSKPVNNIDEVEEGKTYYINLEFPQRLPSNLIIIGTVNMDETTYAFSPKVLDRANTIEFVSVDLGRFENSSKSSSIALESGFDEIKKELCSKGKNWRDKLWGKDEFKEFIKKKEDIKRKLKNINNILAKRNFHFGYRTYQEIWFYLYWWKQVFGDENLDTALDFQILQKILPKINGSSERIGDLLDELIAELLVNNASTLELILGDKNSGDIENIKDNSEAIKEKILKMSDKDFKNCLNKLQNNVREIDYSNNKNNQCKYLRSLYKLFRMKERLMVFDTTSFYEY